MTTSSAPPDFPLVFPAGLFHPSRHGLEKALSILWLTRALTRRGVTVRVVTTTDGVETDGLEHGGITGRYGVNTEYVAGSRWTRYLPRVLAALRAPDRPVVHLSGTLAAESRLAAAACLALGRPFILSPRGDLDDAALARHDPVTRLASIILAPLYRRAAAIHVTGEAEAACVRRTLGEHPRIVMIPDGHDAAPTDEPTRVEIAQAASQGPYLLYLGRIAPGQGLDALVATLPLLPADLRLVIAGDLGEAPEFTRAIRAQIAELGLAARVDLPGPVQGAPRTAILRAADLAVLPAPREDPPGPVLEALAQGTPVLASRETPWRDLADDACGYWTAATPAEMSVAVRRHHALKAPERRAMNERARKLAERRTRTDHLIEDYLELYRRARS